jgi:2-keto-4-pentenoate hydratase/2-oxohepta-3-ene-1,7-dioic acid hydratase in catechol pathway
MRLVSFRRDGTVSFGCLEDGIVRDFGPYVAPGTVLRDCLPVGLPLLGALRDAVRDHDMIPLHADMLLAPIPAPRKFLALGGNYASHVSEAEKAGYRRPPAQVWFNKQVSCVNAPYGTIARPFVSDQLDYEGELGVVIARNCRHVRAEDAWSVVAGYVVCNDVSVRDWQLRSPTHMIGKSFDTHGPFGPWIVTPDEIPDPHALTLRTLVNGEVRQQASTGEMIHRIPSLIAELTTAFTLEAGDILSTGTPAGVGGLCDPPRYLVPDDVVRVEIDGIGFIENRVVEEPLPPHCLESVA